MNLREKKIIAENNSLEGIFKMYLYVKLKKPFIK